MDWSTIVRSLDLESFYSRFISVKKRIGSEILTSCPFHEDEHESLSINLETGLWKCHASSCKHFSGGNAIQFYAYIKGIPVEQAAEELVLYYDIKEVSDEIDRFTGKALDDFNKKLRNSPVALDYLTRVCGWSQATIDKFKIGYDGDRYWIPIYENGELVNVRKYKPDHKTKMLGMIGKNDARIWPIENLDAEKVYIMEGEKDCILANQLGLNAVTVTGGAGTFKNEWAPLFKDKEVIICYDIDEAGTRGAKVVAEFVVGQAQKVKIIALPITDPENADFTNYVVDNKKTLEDFNLLEENTGPFASQMIRKIDMDNNIYDAELADASKKEYYFKRIRVKAVVAGKDLAPYLVPKRLKVNCLQGKKVCAFCGVGMRGGCFEVVFNEESPDILRLVNCTDMQQERAIRERLEVYGNCSAYTYEVLEAQNIEEISLIPEIKYSNDIREYVVRKAYFLGFGCKANQSYELVGITLPHPQTQYATHLIYDAAESDSSVEMFCLTDEIKQQLEVFQCL